jgi:hypothetical protein
MKAQARLGVALLLLLASPLLRAQETPAQRHEMATNQLKNLAVEMSAQCLDDVRTLEDWKNRRAALRQQLLDMDIPEVAGALAPRRLVSLTKIPESFGLTGKIYRLARAVDQFVPSPSLPDALQISQQPERRRRP